MPSTMHTPGKLRMHTENVTEDLSRKMSRKISRKLSRKNVTEVGYFRLVVRVSSANIYFIRYIYV